jgi:hypothetical protein
MNEKARWILQGVLLLSEGYTEEQLIKEGVPRIYLNQIRSTYTLFKDILKET